MKTKHTDGEWYAKDGQIYPIETGRSLVLIPYFEKGNEEQEANQQLISAAPELLEALIKCQFQLQTWAESEVWGVEDEKAYEQAQAAINKATT